MKDNIDIDGHIILFKKYHVFFSLLSEIYVVAVRHVLDYSSECRKLISFAKNTLVAFFNRSLNLSTEMVLTRKPYGNLFLTLENLLFDYCLDEEPTIEDCFVRSKNFTDVDLKAQPLKIEKRAAKDYSNLENFSLPLPETPYYTRKGVLQSFCPSFLAPPTGGRDIFTPGGGNRFREMKYNSRSLSKSLESFELDKIVNESPSEEATPQSPKHFGIKKLKNFKKLTISTNLGEQPEVDLDYSSSEQSTSPTGSTQDEGESDSSLDTLASPVIKSHRGILDLTRISAVPIAFCVNEEISAVYDVLKLEKYKLIGTVSVSLFGNTESNFDRKKDVVFSFKLLKTERIGKLVANKSFCTEIGEKRYRAVIPASTILEDKVSLLRYQLTEGKRPVPIILTPKVKCEGRALSVMLGYKLNPRFPKLQLRLNMVPTSSKIVKERHKPPQFGKFKEDEGKLFWRVPPQKEPVNLVAQFMCDEQVVDTGKVLVKFMCKDSVFSQVVVETKEKIVGETSYVTSANNFSISLPKI